MCWMSLKSGEGGREGGIRILDLRGGGSMRIGCGMEMMGRLCGLEEVGII